MSCCDSNALPANYYLFPAIVTGDHLPSAVNIQIQSQDSTLESVLVTFTTTPGVGSPALVLANPGDVTINADDPGTWDFTIEDFTVNLPAGSYYYQLKTTDSSAPGQTTTWIQGYWEVITSI